jgi:hypothetical protein
MQAGNTEPGPSKRRYRQPLASIAPSLEAADVRLHPSLKQGAVQVEAKRLGTAAQVGREHMEDVKLHAIKVTHRRKDARSGGPR